MGHIHSMLAVAVGALAGFPLAAQDTSPLDSTIPPAVVRTGPSNDDRVTIPIVIDGKGPWNFVIDTGAQRTVIARDLADRLALPSRKTVTVLSMTGRADVPTVAVPRLGFGSSIVDDIEAPVLDGDHLGAPGLLGLDSLHAKRLLLNFRTGRMEISESRKRISRDPDTIIVEARRQRGQLILLDSDVNGMKVNIVLDTGTDFSVGNLALRDKLIRKKRAPELFQASLTSVTGGVLTGEVGRIKAVRMGRVQLTQVPVLFADASPFAELGLSDKPALLLGISALRIFDRVAIDFGRGKVDFLMPDASAVDPVRLAINAPPQGH
ncbi:retroviral-like aspartic protease family protein [Sphingobium sp. AP49]|uniref:retroviral-like aspartic protease family protein n=1 Tax=Sphingobium sp. AP49 TaxID=1144307 RepID=UPI00026EDAAA|nr:retroviral-like aspartic protease family protein [Sphingobium sp. AP49]WHO39068.1 retroviral-like aspartic protease family protein [Sphingobium sp. AP49]